jgi:DNA-binding PadR family transcriptional regulator
VREEGEMSSQDAKQNEQAEAHAAFFAAHGFADVGAPLTSPHGSASGHGALGTVGHAPHGSVRAIVLWALAERPMHGYQVMTEVEQRSGGFWKLSPGSVYPVLQQLADEELATVDVDGSRRVYSLTAAGEAVARAIRESHGPTPWASAKGVGRRRFQLWRATSDLVDVVREAALSGAEENAEETLRILEDASAQLRRLAPSATPPEA